MPNTATSDYVLSPTEPELAGSLEDISLNNAADFMKWFSGIETMRNSESEGKFIAHSAILDRHLAAIDSLLRKTDEIAEIFEALSQAQKSVSERTSALQNTCESLVSDKERLVNLVEQIKGKLVFFNELEHVNSLFSAGAPSVDSSEFLPLLQRLDDALQYILSHPQYADAMAYSSKFKQLQMRALAAARTKVAASLRLATAQAQAALQGQATPTLQGDDNGSQHLMMLEGADAALLYVRFRSVAEPSLKELLQGIEKRASSGSRSEYVRLLRDCEALFCEARLSLLQRPVSAKLKLNSTQSSLAEFLRSGCGYLMQLAQLELQLFGSFFPGRVEQAGCNTIAPLMEPLCNILYDELRPAMLALRDVDTLSELITILSYDILGGKALGLEPESAIPLEPMIRRTIADLQERLTWRAQEYVRDEIMAFVPGPKDLDYPKAPLPGKEPPENEIEAEEETSTDIDDPTFDWYPPVKRVLTLMSKIYKALPAATFNGLAQQAVSAGMKTVLDGARSISTAKSLTDAELFSIKQVLVLREHIASFEAEFAIVERDLDFTHTREAIRKMMTGQLPFLSLSSDNAMLQLVQKGAPRLLENQLDAKKEVERQVKLSCESFIMYATKLAVEPLLTFITKVTAVRITAEGTEMVKPLREQAFASTERLQEVITAVSTALKTTVPDTIKKMKIYLPDPSTQVMLLQPIKSNIIEAHGQIERLLESEYTVDEAKSIGLLDSGELSVLLDSL